MFTHDHTMLILFSYTMCRYDNQLRVEYLVQCEPDELAFFNMTHPNIQGPEDCKDEHENNRCNAIAYKTLSKLHIFKYLFAYIRA